MGNNGNLHKAKKAKNDEFYTQLSDIENELKHYQQHFKDKIVFCNCDDARKSNFFKYFTQQSDILGIKKVICYSGDFRSMESIEYLKQADIVVTNPPFSLFRDYLDTLITYNKEFIIIGNKNAITYKEVFPLIKENKLWLGFTYPQKFYVSDDYEAKNVIVENGIKYATFGNIGWFTNVNHSKRNEELMLYKHYNPEEYPQYDNYNAINVDKVNDIPYDYDGVMGVPITFLDKYNPKQFEIVAQMANTNIDEFNYGYPFINGKRKYARILIRKVK